MRRLHRDSEISRFKGTLIAGLRRHAGYFRLSGFLLLVAVGPLSDISTARASNLDLGQLLQLSEIPAPYRNQWLLMEAVSKGNRLAVETLIAAGTDVNVVFLGQQTPLGMAIKSGRGEIASVLLRRGANPNLGDSQGTTPLFLAIEAKKTELVSLLLKAGADVNAVTRGGDRPLSIAIRTRQAEIVGILLDHGANITARDTYGRTILWTAINQRDAQIVELLLKRGATADDLEAQGYNLLTYAARAAAGPLIRLLVSKGADVNKPDKRERLPLTVAIRGNNTDTVRTLIEIGADIRLLRQSEINSLDQFVANWTGAPASFTERLAVMQMKSANTGRNASTPLHAAAAKGQAELVTALLEAGANPNARQQYGEMPLHFAAQQGHVAVVEILLKRGAQIDATDDFGHTALYTAALYQRPEVVKSLLRHKADVEKADTANDGRTPLFVASDKGNTEVVRLLLAAGANPNAPAKMTGRTPLFNSAVRNVLLARLLLEHGADINFSARDNMTPLILSTCDVQPRNKEIIRFYLDHGADPRRMRNDGSSALGCVSWDGLDDVVELLIERGADPNSRMDVQHETPLMLAVRNGRTSTVKLLLQRGADANLVRKDFSNRYESALDLARAKGNPEIIALLKTNHAEEAARLPKPVAGPVSSSALSTTVTVKLTPEQIQQHQLEAYAAAGRIEQVRELLDKGAKADSRALSSAAEFGRVDIIRLLVRHGADVNAADPFFKRTPLMAATTAGRLDTVETLLELGSNPDANGGAPRGETPLAHAISSDKPAIAEALLKKGANPNVSAIGVAADGYGGTLLIGAVKQHKPELAALLAKYGADTNAQDRAGSTALHYAVWNGELNIVRSLLKSGARIDIMNKAGDTPILMAAGNKNPQLVALFLETNSPQMISPAVFKAVMASDNFGAVRELLRRGADPNARDPDTGIPLLILHLNSARSTEITKLLVEHDANPNLVAADGSSALLLAIDKSFDDLAGLMLHKGADPLLMNDRNEFPLLRAIQRGRFELVRLMRDRGTSLNYQNMKGETGLMGLAGVGDKAGVDKLLELGANPDVVSRQGETALILAVRGAKADVVKALASKSKTINHVADRGYSALHEAVMAGKPDIVQILLDARAGTEIPSHDGLTPLMLAARASKLDIAALLLDRGADVNVRSRYQHTPHDYSSMRYTGNGKTALMYAVSSGSVEMTALLLRHNASVNVQDDEGNTALIMAANAKPEMIRTLTKAGAKPELRNKLGLTAADYAKLAGRSHDIVTRGGPDPQFASPEKTWERFLAALRRADRQAAIACLTSNARDKFAPVIKQATNQELESMGSATKEFRVTTRFGEFVEAVTVRQDDHAGIITFENIDGEWKIVEM